MNPDDFRKIEEKFTTSSVSHEYLDVAFKKFIEKVEAGIQLSKDTNGKDPTPSELRKICDACLSEPDLETYVTLAKVNRDTEKQDRALNGTNTRSGFWMGVWGSIVANFAFLVLLLLTFSFGRDQWLAVLEFLDLTPPL